MNASAETTATTMNTFGMVTGTATIDALGTNAEGIRQ